MLNIYKSVNPDDFVSDENPLISSHDIALGSWNTIKLWVRNSDSSKYYESVKVRLDLEENPTESGTVYLLRKGNIEPTALEWGNSELATDINLVTKIGSEEEADTETYHPFFLRIYVPADANIGYSSECNISIIAIQEPVI